MRKAEKIAREISELIQAGYEFPDAEWEATKNLNYSDKDQKEMNEIYDTL